MVPFAVLLLRHAMGKFNFWDFVCAVITLCLFAGIGVMLAWRG